MNELPESSLTELAEENSQDIHEFFLASKLEIEKVKRRKKQFTISLVALCSFSLLGFFFVSLLWRNSEKLQDQIENTSKANAIATKAYTLLEHDPTLAFRLAEESYKIDPTHLNKQVIMAAYAQVPFYEKLEGHIGGCTSAKYSPDGKYIATLTQEEKIFIWDANSLKKLAEINVHHGNHGPNPNAINFSNDSKLLVSASKDSTARLWNLNGECLAILKHNGPVNSVCFSPDDNLILTASSDKTARVWELSGRELFRMDHEKAVKTAIFSPTRKEILTISDLFAFSWDFMGKKNKTYNHIEGIYCAAFSNNGNLIGIGGREGNAAILDNSLNNKIVLNGHKAMIDNIVFDPFDSLILTASDDLSLKLWNLKGKPLYTYLGHNSAIWTAVFSPDGKKISSVSDDGTGRIWDLRGHEMMLLMGHTSQVQSIQFAPNGKQVITSSGDKTARIWTIEPEENPILKGHTGYVFDSRFSESGKEIITSGADYISNLWSFSGKLINQFKKHDHYFVEVADFIPKSDNLLSVSYDGNLRVRKRNGEILQKFNHHSGFGSRILYSQQKNEIIHWSNDNEAQLYSINDSLKFIYEFKNTIDIDFYNESYISSCMLDSSFVMYSRKNNRDSVLFHPFISLKVPKTSFSSSEFSPDRKWLAIASEDSMIRILNMEELLFEAKNQKAILPIKINSVSVKYSLKLNSIITSVSFSPKENIFISNSSDNILRLWNIEGKQLAEYIGHSDEITDVNFSPDGNWIISGSSDKSVRLWDLKGNEIQNYPGHHHKVKKAKFSPEGKYILSCSNDHTARLMPVAIEQVLSKINREKVRGNVYKLGEQELKVYGVE